MQPLTCSSINMRFDHVIVSVAAVHDFRTEAIFVTGLSRNCIRLSIPVDTVQISTFYL